MSLPCLLDQNWTTDSPNREKVAGLGTNGVESKHLTIYTQGRATDLPSVVYALTTLLIFCIITRKYKYVEGRSYE
jgi:hypothetical protein